MTRGKNEVCGFVSYRIISFMQIFSSRIRVTVDGIADSVKRTLFVCTANYMCTLKLIPLMTLQSRQNEEPGAPVHVPLPSLVKIGTY